MNVPGNADAFGFGQVSRLKVIAIAHVLVVKRLIEAIAGRVGIGQRQCPIGSRREEHEVLWCLFLPHAKPAQEGV